MRGRRAPKKVTEACISARNAEYKTEVARPAPISTTASIDRARHALLCPRRSMALRVTWEFLRRPRRTARGGTTTDQPLLFVLLSACSTKHALSSPIQRSARNANAEEERKRDITERERESFITRFTQRGKYYYFAKPVNLTQGQLWMSVNAAC